MTGRCTRFGLAWMLALSAWGCGGKPDAGQGAPGEAGRKPPVFVGFDASPELVEALRDGRIKGLVVQHPYSMGNLGVTKLVETLEGKPVEPKISTGEVMATPENMNEPEIAALLDPPKFAGDADPALARPRKWRVLVIPKGTTHEFWKTIHAGALKAAEDLGNVEVVWHGPERESDREQQIALVENAAVGRYHGIVLAPLDSEALVDPVEALIGRGIPVVIIDSGLHSTKPVSYIATDNYRGGVLAARRLGQLLDGKGRIILLRYAEGSESTEQRERGFTDTMAKEFPAITYLSDNQYAGATADTAQAKSETLVTRYGGQIDGIFCPNESSTFGMLRALEDRGLIRAGTR